MKLRSKSRSPEEAASRNDSPGSVVWLDRLASSPDEPDHLSLDDEERRERERQNQQTAQKEMSDVSKRKPTAVPSKPASTSTKPPSPPSGVPGRGKYVAPPGMEHVVRRLKRKKDVNNPYAVAWSMHDRLDGHRSSETFGVFRVKDPSNVFDRNLLTLEHLARNPRSVDQSIVDRLFDDAVEDLKRTYQDGDDEGLNYFRLWRELLEDAKKDASETVVRNRGRSIGIHRYVHPEVDSVESGDPGGTGGDDSIRKVESTGDELDMDNDDQGPTDTATEEVQEGRDDDQYEEEEVLGEMGGEGGGIDKQESEEFYRDLDALCRISSVEVSGCP